MIRSLRTGISGIQAQQVKMDVIGNNIANVNTIAYKRARAAFGELLGERMLGVGRMAGGDPTRVGTGVPTNSYVGLGVQVLSIDHNWAQGSIENTNISTDLALSGDGFFLARGADGVLLSRAGNFTFNRYGELVTSNGLNVQGWRFDESGQLVTGSLNDITVDLNATIPPKKTENIHIGGNFSADAEVGDAFTVSSVAFDAQGGQHTFLIEFQRVAASGQYGATEDTWRYTVKDESGNPIVLRDASGTAIPSSNPIGQPVLSNWGQDSAVPTMGGTYTGTANRNYDFTVSDMIDVDTDGTDDTYVVNWTDGDGGTGTIHVDMATGNIAASSPNADVDGMTMSFAFGGSTPGLNVGDTFSLRATVDQEATDTLTFGSDGTLLPNNVDQEGNATFGFSFDLDGDGTLDDYTLNFGNPDDKTTSQYSGSTTTAVRDEDGYGAGQLNGYTFNSEGILELTFSNGQRKQLYQIAIGLVNNPHGLEQLGENFYSTTSMSGDLQITSAGLESRTAIVSGSLEMSNVDLAAEFTDMIVAQRAFQASARVVTTSDEMLQETVSLKR